MNLPFAAATTTQAALMERLRQIPPDFWWKIAIGVGAVVAVVIILRKVAKMNPLLLSIGLAFAGSAAGSVKAIVFWYQPVTNKKKKNASNYSKNTTPA